MKAAAFDYRCPSTIEEAIQWLAEHGGRAKLAAGTQSFGPMLNLRLTRPQLVIDITRLPGMDSVKAQADFIHIGAGVTHSAIEDGVHLALAQHPMCGVAAGIAYRAIRNRGTLGGSLAHADPAADWIVALSALEAQLTLQSPRGVRNIAMKDFMHAAYTTALESDEAILSVRVPKATTESRWGYYKFCRKPGEFAEASAAIWWRDAQSTPSIVLGALDGAPLHLSAFASRLANERGKALSRAEIAEAVQAALPDGDEVDNQLRAVCLARALMQAGIDVPAAKPLEVRA